MITLQKNIFVVGPQAVDASFFGRENEVRELETSIFGGVGAVHLVGPTRIGKSSLVSKVFDRNKGQPKRLRVLFSMGECMDAWDFWNTLVELICDELQGAALWNQCFTTHYERIHKLDHTQPNWFSSFKPPFCSILKEIGRVGCRLVIAIDEFDSVERIFGQASYYFQVLRSVFERPDYNTSGVLISRRRLHLFEAKCPDISTFHGVFREMPLQVFSPADMEAFYEALSSYNIRVSSNGKKKLEYYTGRLPYFCCMFGERMVAQQVAHFGSMEIEDIFKECLPQIDRHYDDLITRLEADGHMEFIFYLSIGSKLPNVTNRDIENMRTMGILIPEERGGRLEYYAFSRDFMTYFRSKPLQLPAWETMTFSEKKLKAIFKKEFPELDTVTYEDLAGNKSEAVKQHINSIYPELHLEWNEIITYCKTLSAHKKHPTILDVLTLSKVVGVMLKTWEKRFYRYFDGDTQWKSKLGQIRKLRNPMAHAQLEYVDADELAVCLKYCEELIHLKY